MPPFNEVSGFCFGLWKVYVSLNFVMESEMKQGHEYPV